ncbi:MAG: 50S ribosomal protein L23 [Patescibacteria group bacterium]|nr:MAG: 50S ribosomal protein L23 [Patescibacteria group bacterium]
MDIFDIIKRPLITERSLEEAKKNRFSFLVDVSATKEQIKKAIEEIFKVDVVSVDTRIQKGRTQRVGIRRTVRKLTPTKKAVVTLKEGQKIDIFDLGV